MYFIGNGIDIHKLVKKRRKLIIGGIEIDSDYSIIAHSDGDVLLHSLSDAILGALSLGDIGQYFSDKDNKNKNLDSKKILLFVLEKMHDHQFSFVNIDITILCQKIFIEPHKHKIIKFLKDVTCCDRINLKATRFEKENNFIECHTTILLKK